MDIKRKKTAALSFIIPSIVCMAGKIVSSLSDGQNGFFFLPYILCSVVACLNVGAILGGGGQKKLLSVAFKNITGNDCFIAL